MNEAIGDLVFPSSSSMQYGGKSQTWISNRNRASGLDFAHYYYFTVSIVQYSTHTRD
jgi:hypothetical protein